MDSYSFSDARNHFTDIINDVAYRGSRAVITRKGKKFVAIVSIEDLEMLQALEDRIDIHDAKKALADAEKNGTTSWEALTSSPS